MEALSPILLSEIQVLEHRRYWHYVRKSNPPLLRACIVNVHPIRQDTLPSNYDALVDRKNDLTYHDRTLFDERMVTMLTDYLDIIERLVKLAQANGVAKASLDEIFKEQALTRNFLTGKPGTVPRSSRRYGSHGFSI